MRAIILSLLLPALLFGQGEISILRTKVDAEVNPAVIVAVFVEQPEIVLDTIGWKPAGESENEPITRKLLRGRVIERVERQDSTLMNGEYHYFDWIEYQVIERDFQVNWAMADTLLNLTTALADSNLVMRKKFVGGLFLPSGTVVTNGLIDADSVWRANR